MAVPASGAARTTRRCWRALPRTGPRSTAAGYAHLRRPLARLARPRGRVVRTVRRPGPAPVTGRGGRDPGGRGRGALPTARAGSPCAARARRRPRRRARHGGGAPRGRAPARGVAFVEGAVARRRRRGAPAGGTSSRSAWRVSTTSTATRWRSRAVPGRPAAGEWLGRDLPVGPTKGQIVHLGVDGRDRRLAHRAAAADPLPRALARGRVACGGTFEAGAGFSVCGHRRRAARAAAGVPARGARPRGGATYLETRVGLRPTSADDRALVGRLPGLG